MFRKSVVSIFMIILGFVVASEIEHAVGYIFNTVYTMLIELKIGNIPFKEPELLDCDKYIVATRRKREIKENIREPSCLYNFRYNLTLSK